MNKCVYGLDSFQGFDKSVQKYIALSGRGLEKPISGFEPVALTSQAKLAGPGMGNAVRVIPGQLAKMLERLSSTSLSFAYLDC
jgi:hypothetical protein